MNLSIKQVLSEFKNETRINLVNTNGEILMQDVRVIDVLALCIDELLNSKYIKTIYQGPIVEFVCDFEVELTGHTGEFCIYKEQMCTPVDCPRFFYKGSTCPLRYKLS